MKQRILKLFFAIMLGTFFLSGCIGQSTKEKSIERNLTGNTSSSQEDKTLKTISGKVIDIHGNSIAGVTVSNGSTSVVTDAKGGYLLDIPTASAIALTARKSGFTSNGKSLTEDESQVDFVLAPADLHVIFDASRQKSLDFKNARVILPANGFINASGDLYSGEVTAYASYHRVTTTPGASLFPGKYIGLQGDGSQTGILSYGFIEVTIEDASGIPLQLAPGKLATITYPMDAHISETPQSIPLWYYDTKKGIWVEDGSATYDAATNSYTGEVSHFTVWNLDKKFNGAALKGCVEDVNGMRIPEAELFISTPGWQKYGTNRDENGEFKLINAPSGTPIYLMAKLDGKVSEKVPVTLSAGTTTILPECLKINIDASELFANITGRLLMSDGTTPLTGEDANIEIVSSNGRVESGSIDENGTFVISNVQRVKSENFHLQIYIYNMNKTFVYNFSLDPAKETTDVGDIILKLTEVSGCVDANVDFSMLGWGTYVSIDHAFLPSSFNRDDYSDNRYSIDDNGNFHFFMLQDGEEHAIYAMLLDDNLTGNNTFIADREIVDLSDHCIQTHTMQESNITIDAAINAIDSNISLKVTYNTYPDLYFDGDIIIGTRECETNANGTWECRIIDKTDIGSFQVNRNGLYFVGMTTPYWDNYSFEGTITVTVNSQTFTLQIDQNTFGNREWIGYVIELYEGQLTVKEINQEAYYGQ